MSKRRLSIRKNSNSTVVRDLDTRVWGQGKTDELALRDLKEAEKELLEIEETLVELGLMR